MAADQAGATDGSAAADGPGPAGVPDPGSAGAEPAKVLMPVYVPEGYELRKAVPLGPVAVAPSRRPRSLLLGITLTLIAGVLVGYLAGFAVARRTGDASVTVTVHDPSRP